MDPKSIPPKDGGPNGPLARFIPQYMSRSEGVKPRIEIESAASWVVRVVERGGPDETNHLRREPLARGAAGDGEPHQCRAAHPSLQSKWRSGYARIQTDSVSFLGLTPSRPPLPFLNNQAPVIFCLQASAPR